MKVLVILAISFLALFGGSPCSGFISPRSLLPKIPSSDRRHVQHFAEGVEAGVEIASGHARMNLREQESAATVFTGVEAELLTDKIGDGGNWSIGEAIVTVSALVVAVVCLFQAGSSFRNSRARKAHKPARFLQEKLKKWFCLYLVVWHCISETCNHFYTTTHDGQFLTRLNRRNGKTKTIGKWQGGTTETRVIDTLEWHFPGRMMYGLELNEDRPTQSQRLVMINRQKPRGANINDATRGSTGRRDLMGMAVDGTGMSSEYV